MATNGITLVQEFEAYQTTVDKTTQKLISQPMNKQDINRWLDRVGWAKHLKGLDPTTSAAR